MEKNKYRIITNGYLFRIEIFQSWTYRAGWFWLKKVTQEQWVPCDNVGMILDDGDGYRDEFEIIEYDSLEEAKAKIKDWTTSPLLPPAWKVVWP